MDATAELRPVARQRPPPVVGFCRLKTGPHSRPRPSDRGARALDRFPSHRPEVRRVSHALYWRSLSPTGCVLRIASSISTRDRTPFIGRARERALLLEDLERGTGFLTVAGPSGIGKTRLAKQVAGE